MPSRSSRSPTDVLVIVIDGQCQPRGCQTESFDCLCGFYAVDCGIATSMAVTVGMKLSDQSHRLLTIARLNDDLEVPLAVEELPDALTDQMAALRAIWGYFRPHRGSYWNKKGDYR